MLSTEPRKTCTPKSCSALIELSFERFSERIAFRELSNSPPLTRSCQEGSDAISLDSAFYAGPAIAFCDGSRIHGDADRGDLDCGEERNEFAPVIRGVEFALFEGDKIRVLRCNPRLRSESRSSSSNSELKGMRNGSTRCKGSQRWRPARCWCSSFVKRARPPRTYPDTRGDPAGTALPRGQWTVSVPEQLMKNNFEHKAEVAVPLTSRRKFISAAVAIGGAGMLSAELGMLSARGNAELAAQIAVLAATKDLTPFKVRVPQAALDDLKRRLASTRWPERETVSDWSQGVPLQKAQAL